MKEVEVTKVPNTPLTLLFLLRLQQIGGRSSSQRFWRKTWIMLGRFRMQTCSFYQAISLTLQSWHAHEGSLKSSSLSWGSESWLNSSMIWLAPGHGVLFLELLWFSCILTSDCSSLYLCKSVAIWMVLMSLESSVVLSPILAVSLVHLTFGIWREV